MCRYTYLNTKKKIISKKRSEFGVSGPKYLTSGEEIAKFNAKAYLGLQGRLD